MSVKVLPLLSGFLALSGFTLPAQVTECVNDWDAVGYQMKASLARSGDAVVCADYKDIVSVDARKACSYVDAKSSISTVVKKATSAYESCVNLHAGSPIDWCGGLAAELNHDLEMMANIDSLVAWESCVPDRCAVRIASTGARLATTGGAASVSVTAKAGDCTWDVATAANWIHPLVSRGAGNGTVQTNIDPNSGRLRTGNVTIGPRTWTITQEGVPCQYRISPNAITAPAGGTSGIIRVDASSGDCQWHSFASANLAIWDGASKSADMVGSANMPYVVAPNWAGKETAQTITVDTTQIPVRQLVGSGAVLGHFFEAKTLTAGKTYVLEGVVSNPSPVSTKGTVTARFGIPANLKPTDLSTTATRPQWTCKLADLSCSRSDVLAAGGRWTEGIRLTVEVVGPVTGDIETSFTTTVNGVTADAVTSRTRILFPPLINAVYSAFDHKVPAVPNVFAPGEAISIYGERLCPTASAAPLPLPDFLSGCRVKMGDTMLHLYYASPTQINAYIPRSIRTGSTALAIWRDPDPTTANPRWRSTSADFKVLLTSPTPTFLEVVQAGVYNLFLQLPDGGFISAAQPMRAGQILTIYLTGLGSLTESIPDDTGAGKAVTAAAAVKVTVGGLDATVYYAGVQPEFPGLDQITFKVPAYNPPAGSATIPLKLQVGTLSTAQYDIPAR